MSDGSDSSDYSESESDVEPKETVCKLCKREFANKYIKRRHQKRCGKGPSPLNKCMWCGMQFANRGNLATHAFHIHGDSSYKLLDGDKDRIYQCSVCNKGYKMKMFLTFHIRKNHFNLQAKIPCAERKKVNQVWFEKVLNSNKVVEIKKASASSLIMRSLNENTGIKVKDIDPKVVDLRNIYPTRTAQSSVECYVCHKKYQKKNFKKHFDEVHLNKRRNHCNLCNHTFKRAYQYLKHRCHKVKVKGIRSERGSAFRIASVESLSMP